MKRRCAILAIVKNEEVFLPFWLEHYTRCSDPQDLFIHSDGSTDSTAGLCRGVGVNFHEIPPGTVPVGKNDRYIKGVITQLLASYECVLFAESPDDIIVPGHEHGHDMTTYIDEFLESADRHRFLTAINVMHTDDDAAYDPKKGTLLSQRTRGVRCPQYDNAFMWKDTPTWGRGWHDLGGPRIVGGGDTQGENKRLYNLHIHYADFDLCNRRHHDRQRTFSPEQLNAYESRTDLSLRGLIRQMADHPEKQFSGGYIVKLEPWMQRVI